MTSEDISKLKKGGYIQATSDFIILGYSVTVGEVFIIKLCIPGDVIIILPISKNDSKYSHSYKFDLICDKFLCDNFNFFKREENLKILLND